MTSPYLEQRARTITEAVVDTSPDKMKALVRLAQAIIETYYTDKPISTAEAWLRAAKRELER